MTAINKWPEDMPPLLPWQEKVLTYIATALDEGRTKPAYVQSRRGGFWTFVAPDENGSNRPDGDAQ